MTLTEMRSTLEAHRVRLTRSLGQNFLHDGNQLRRIADLADLRPADRVIEIGPGLGPLTALLLERAGSVTAIETDQRLVRILEHRFSGAANLRLIQGDALDYVRRSDGDFRGWKVVANLPYSIASPLLVEFSLARHPPETMVVTLQLEVAQRLRARPGVKAYGVLTLLVGLSYSPVSWFKVSAACFFPRPDVDSACVRLDLRSGRPESQSDREAFRELVRTAFSARRKMLFNVLKRTCPEPDLLAAFEKVGLDLRRRPENLTGDQYLALARLVHPSRARA